MGPGLASADNPTVGIVYHTTENSAITYSCQREGQEHLNCKFQQMRIRTNAKAEDLPQELEKARGQYSEKVMSELQKDCGTYRKLLRLLNGEQVDLGPNFDRTRYEGLSEPARQRLGATIGSVIRMCEKPSLQSFLGFVEAAHLQRQKTCTVSVNPFEQRFKRTHSGSWTVVDEPGGICGVVNLDRFEPAENPSGVSSGSVFFWRYHARKAVTDPSGGACLNEV